MIIKEINLNNFRNYIDQNIKLEKGINVFYGNNAQGKTNLLEAIFICAIGKSFRTNKEKELIFFDSNKTKIDVYYKKSDRDGKISLEIADKKKFLLNDILLKKTSEVLGNIYVVLFTPDDINILKEGPSKRRRFLDIIISQLRPTYMHLLSDYNKSIIQRNIYLRQINYENKNNILLLDTWDDKIIELGKKIYNYRKEFIEKIELKINNIHSKITNKKENISIKYISDLNNDNFKEEFLKNRDIDIKRGNTSIGIHKDDFKIKINNKIISSYGSQGQHRTAILSLKIAELEIIEDEVGEYPILLLDDFMSELDEERRNNLLKNMKNNQVIITCTDKSFFEDLNANFFNVNNGIIKKE